MNKIFVSTEGHLDRVLLERTGEIRKFTSIDVYPKPMEEGGKDRALRLALSWIRNKEPDIVIALDLDEMNPVNWSEWTLDWLSRESRSPAEPTHTERIFHVAESNVHLVGLGLPEDSDVNALGIRSHAADDYVLKMILDEACFEKLRAKEGGRGKIFPDHPTVVKKLNETRDLFESQGVFFGKSKQILQILKSITMFGASDAQLARSILESAPVDLLHSVLPVIP